LWIVDAIKNYIQEGGRFLAKEVEDGAWITTGDPENYLRAIMAYALDVPELKAVINECCGCDDK